MGSSRFFLSNALRGFPMLALVVAVLGMATTASIAEVGVTVRPVPAWVDLEPVDTAGARPMEGVPFLCLLLETQINQIADPPEELHRAAYYVGSLGGVQACSRLTADFDPSYQQLIFHFVRLRRGGRSIDCLRSSSIEILRREPELEASLIGGTRTALLLLHDVRVGDVLEYAYTIRGRHPAMGRHYSTELVLGLSSPVNRLRHRLLWPTGRPVWFREHGTKQKPLIRDFPGGKEYLWTCTHVEGLHFDEDAPAWFDPHPFVQVSTFADWAEVARWGTDVFRGPSALSAALRAKVEEIHGAHARLDERARAAIRFVQDEIRYQGIEIGAGGLRPAPPDVVLARRFGDCKDKTLLLVTLLRGLGITADVALVHDESGAMLEKWHPTSRLFDHAVVRILLGETHWIDATKTMQRGGSLTRMAQPDYGWALVLRDDTKGLQKMSPLGPESKTEIVKDFSVGEMGEPTKLEVSTTYSGEAADRYRAMRRAVDTHKLTDDGRHYYAVLYPDIVAEKPVDVYDDEDANRIVTHEHFRIPAFWAPSDDSLFHYADFSPQEVLEALPSEPAGDRQSPFALEHPRHVIYEAHVHLPRGFAIEPEAAEVKNSFFCFEAASQQKGQDASFSYAYDSYQDAVPRWDVPRFKEDRDRVFAALPAAVSYESRNGWLGIPRALNWPAALIVLLALVAASVAASRLYRWHPAVVEPGILGPPWRRAPIEEVVEDAPAAEELAEESEASIVEEAEDVPAEPTEEWIAGQPIGGWLWVMGFALCLGLLRILRVSGTSLQGFSLGTWLGMSRPGSALSHPLVPVVLLYEPCANAIMVVGQILLIVLFVQRRRTFPRLFATFVVASILILVGDLVLSLLVPMFRTSAPASIARSIFGVFIGNVFWLTYLHRSKRARATFVN